MHWYRLDVDHIDKIYTYCGASPLAPSEFATALTQVSFVHLTSLVYRDSQRRFQPWKNWEPQVDDEVWINPSRVIAFQVISGNPREEFPL